MGLFDKLTKDQKIVLGYTLDEFTLIDAKAFIAEHDIINLAKQEAKKELPRSDSKSPDANELQIKQKVNEEAIQAGNKLNQAITDLDNQIANIDVESIPNNVVQLGDKFKEDIDAEFKEDYALLRQLKEQVTEAWEERRVFKQENSIHRSAQYKDSNILKVAILIIVLLAESAFNSSLFAQGDDFGLIGGWLQAGMVSFFNIVFGFIAGYFLLRRKNHINKKVAISGSIGFLISIISIIVFNLLVAHYREALILDPDNAAKAAIESFKAPIAGLEDIQSWFLFVLGLVAAFIAGLEGYIWDDPYPGFGKMDRKYVHKKKEFDYEKTEALKKLDEKYQSYINELKESFDDLLRYKANLLNYVAGIKKQKQLHASLLEHLTNLCEIAVTKYRDINSSERDSDPPKYFDEKVEFGSNLEPIKTLETNKIEQIESALNMVAAKQGGVERNFRQVRDSNRAKITSI